MYAYSKLADMQIVSNLTVDQVDEFISKHVVYDEVRKVGNGTEYYFCHDLLASVKLVGWTDSGEARYDLFI